MKDYYKQDYFEEYYEKEKRILNNYIAIFGVIYNDGFYKPSYGTSCYGDLSGWESIGEKPKAIMLTIRNMNNKENGITYYEWLFNYSVFRDCFITKDAKYAYETNRILLYTDRPSNMVVSAAIMARLPCENFSNGGPNCRAVVGTFHDLVTYGVHPDFAYLASRYFIKNPINGRYIIENIQSGHILCPKNLSKFINHSPIKSNLGKPWNIKLNYYRLEALWEVKISESDVEKVMNKIMLYTKKNVIETNTNTNPFVSTKDSKLYKYNKFLPIFAKKLLSLEPELRKEK